MAREPKPESCILCRRRVWSDIEERRILAEHRLAHRQRERRRSQWRASKQRRKQLGANPELAGQLHSLGCSGKPHRAKPSCTPIPVFRRKLAAA